MSQSICSRCLTRSLHAVESAAAPSQILQRAAFSTTPSLAANPPKKKAAVAKPTSRQGKTLRLNRNKRESTGRPPAPGERKALRKRIILSNTNALEVKGLQDLSGQNINAENLAQLEGKVLGLTNESVDALRALEAFKHTQGWSLFRRPATLVRKETVEMAGLLQKAEGGEGNEREVVKRVLFGEKGSGKSVLQLQAMALALQRGWIVIHFPNGQDLANAHTSYQPSPDNKSYIQPHYTASLLQAIATANSTLLSTLRLSQKHDLPMPVQSNISLLRFAELGARDPALAHPIYVALMRELRAPSQPKSAGEGLSRPPLFLGFDGVDHVMRVSAYLDSAAKLVHAHDLALVGEYMGYLNGSLPLPNGGMVLAAVSQSNRASSPSLDHVLAAKHDEATNYSTPVFDPHKGWQTGLKLEWDPYTVFDGRVGNAMEKAEAVKVAGLSREEAKGVMEYYALSGMLRSAVTEQLVSEKWSLSGGGIVGELERGTIKGRV